MKKRKERVSSESTLSSVVGITAEGSTALTLAASESKAHKVVIEDLALVERDALSGIKGRDFDSACGLTETRALIVWQASPILEEMVAHNQLDSKQDPESFRLPATSDIENQRQGPTAQMTNISFMVESSSSARPTVQDDENLRGDFLTLINESNARIMGRYDAHISKLKAENTKSIEELENERERTRILEERLQRELENERTAAAERTRLLEKKLQRELEHEREAAIERTRILEERLQRELENERAAAAERTRLLEKKLQSVEHDREAAIERTRVLDERFQRESEIAHTTASRNEALKEEIFKLNEELEHGRADNKALMSDILEKSEELATLKYYSNMLESEKTHLENQVDYLDKELKYARKEHRRYVSKVLDAARAIPNDLEPINSDALPGSRRKSGIC
ncbi:unnamed protein product [Miscanthus lutarioriparius]|uniref:Uncharacterized protein n=1 Tax=Miscanthus lutarioriparius TaxID=422564 RepID=A0A811NBG0_9POAL|nr:unnamed protein product [Miscanthus lutarioriparius]